MQITLFRITTQGWRSLPALCLLLGAQTACAAETPEPLAISLKLGEMADYGASPWYTEDIALGENRLKMALDSGANFIWATSDRCHSVACGHHNQVDTSQAGFVWVDPPPISTPRSFGPWGTMMTETGQVAFTTVGADSLPMKFFASVDYAGNKFEYLAWDGGIGFPATTPTPSPDPKANSSFYFGELYSSGVLAAPTFSMVTETTLGEGIVYLGGDYRELFLPDTEVVLEPNRVNLIDYIWGTDLYSFELGGQTIHALTHARFYLDSGSSRFKGDQAYVGPILEALYALQVGNERIFDKVMDDGGNWVSLVYANGKGPDDYAGILPDISLTMGQSCGGNAGQSALITLTPQQYSYQVQVGDRAGSWAPAFGVLNGVGGLLVGSTFMDRFYTRFTYQDDGNNNLTQGNMYLYLKSGGSGPAAMSCVATPHPLQGVWFNSYCSQVSLDVAENGSVTGTYTSHTGSTGSSAVVGWVGDAAPGASGEGMMGTPLALGIQWRLINLPASQADGSWHWVSNFSGQLHPAQIVSENGQQPYVLNQTMEVMNGLVATATVDGLTNTVPKMWPETLSFGRIPPAYCEWVEPPTPVPFSGNAVDNVSGRWNSETGDRLQLEANILQGTVSGNATIGGENYTVAGLVDAIAADGKMVVAEQGLTLVLHSDTGGVLSMAGGVNLQDTRAMSLWVDRLTSTTWTYRFMESQYDKVTWRRQ